MAWPKARVVVSAVAAVWLSLTSPIASSAEDSAWQALYPEGPAWIGGHLYWAEMQSHRVMKLNEGTPTVFVARPGCGPTAVSRYRQGDFLVLCHLEASLLHVSAAGEVLATITHSAGGHRLRNPNDASADGNGGVWFTDPGIFSARATPEGAIYHLSPGGELTRHVTGLAYGNGVYVDQLNRRLLLSEHLGRRVLAYPLIPGGLGEPETIVDLRTLGLPPASYAEAGPDGLEIGPNGVLWIAYYGTGTVLGWDPNEGLVSVLNVAPTFITNLAFSPDGDVVMTGSFENTRQRNRGAVWIIPLERLRQ